MDANAGAEVSKELSDQEAVVASLRDRDMFRVLVEKYHPLLTRYVSRLGADPEAAMDIVQESFVKAYVNLNDFDQSRSFNAWIYAITHNMAMDHFRTQRSRPQPIDLTEHAETLEDMDTHTIEHELDMHLDAGRLRQALKQIPARYFDVLVLRFFEEKNYDEIADILHLPPGTVSTYLTRGKAELRAVLTEGSGNKGVL